MVSLSEELSTSELEFDFKKGLCTNHWSGLLKCIISRYLNRCVARLLLSSMLGILAITFDCINHSVFFFPSRLIDHGLSTPIYCTVG